MPFNTLFIGQNLIELATVDSSNNYALNLIKAGNITEGTLIWAHEQTAGRGQRGNHWHSLPLQNLTFSLVVCPRFISAKDQFLLTQMASLALSDFVSEILGLHAIKADVRIKWPNDIYVESRKISGILIENTIKQQEISNSVIGVGININQTDFSDAANAISIKQLIQKDVDLSEALSSLCSHLEARYLQLKTNKTALLKTDYLNRLYQLNELKEYKNTSTGSVFSGEIIGVSLNGKLTIKTKNTIQEFDLKEVEFKTNPRHF